MLAAQQVAECLTAAATSRRIGLPDGARDLINAARDWRLNGARELVANRLYELERPAVMNAHRMAPKPLNARAMSKADACALYHAAEAQWSALLADAFGPPGSDRYDTARYHTPAARWPLRVRLAYEVRDEARQAWEALAYPQAA